MWAAVLGGSAACYLIKLVGLSLPASVLSRPVVQRVAVLLPVAVLSALAAIQTFGAGHSLVVDARAAGLAAAVVALVLRAPFIVIVAVAAAVTALVRLA